MAIGTAIVRSRAELGGSGPPEDQQSTGRRRDVHARLALGGGSAENLCPLEKSRFHNALAAPLRDVEAPHGVGPIYAAENWFYGSDSPHLDFLLRQSELIWIGRYCSVAVIQQTTAKMSKAGQVHVVLDEMKGGGDKVGTTIDQQDMDRVGKTQELRRNFRFLSVLGFTAVLMCTWEAILL